MRYKKILSFLVVIALVLATFASFSVVNAVEGDMDSSVVLNKSAQYLSNGKVEITLETYATAEYSSYVEYPDMIFVLDMSASMMEPVNDTNGDGITDPALGEQSRYDVMIESLSAVINQIHTDGAGAKVAFIKYSDVNQSGVYYKVYNPDESYYIDVDYTGNYPKDATATTQTLFFDLANETEYQSAIDLVNGDLAIPVVGGYDYGLTVNPDGLSRSDKGLEYDWNIINSSPAVPDGSVTIFYSDGYPKQSSTDDSPNLNKATQTYSAAKNIKNYPATQNNIYAMILDGDPVELNNTGQAYDLNHDGWFTIQEFADGISSNTLGGAYVSNQYSFVLSPGGSYSADLIAAFETILNAEITGPEYGAESQVRDYLTEIIELPEVTTLGAGTLDTDDSVRVFTSAFTGFDGSSNYTFSPTWVELSEADGISLNVDGASHGVYVAGFDYTQNLCYYDSDMMQNYGNKLIIVITTDLIPGFIGGNLVETNTDMSGFYADMNATSPINYFENPTIDVPLEYEVDPVNKKVYITNTACDIEVLAQIVDGVANYSQDDQRLTLGDFTVGGDRNDYVNISYAFYDGTTYLGTLSIAAGSATITGTLSDIGQLLSDKTIKVTVTVTPIYAGGYSALTYDLYPVIEVVDPTINLQNSINFLGEISEYDQFVESVYWPPIAPADYIGCGATVAEGMPDLLITPVDFTTGVAFNGDYDVIGTPIHGKAKVVADLDVDVDITGYANYHNVDIPSDINEFYLTIVDGEFKIAKTSEAYSNLVLIDSNQGFIFKIEQFATDSYAGTPITTFYVTLDNAQEVETIKYLYEGYYKITEIDEWSDKYNTVASQYIFVGRDDSNNFYYVNNDLDGTNVGSQSIVADQITDDQLDFNFTVVDNYNWIGDEAVARNLIPNVPASGE